MLRYNNTGLSIVKTHKGLLFSSFVSTAVPTYP